MSGVNGDKSRFNRIRKQKIARRMRKRALLKGLAGPHKPASVPSGSPVKATTV
jgi:hypothetical protein